MLWQAIIIAAVICVAYEFGLRRSRKTWEASERGYLRYIESLKADNLDLRGRLFMSKGYAPPGVDVTEQYQEKQAEKKERAEGVRRNGKPPAGPLEKWQDQMKKKDYAERQTGVDVASTKTH